MKLSTIFINEKIRIINLKEEFNNNNKQTREKNKFKNICVLLNYYKYININ